MNSIFDQLQTVLYKKFSFHYDQIQPETKLELELGMDSRELFELLNELEQVFEICMDLDEIDMLLKNEKIITISDIVIYIRKKKQIS